MYRSTPKCSEGNPTKGTTAWSIGAADGESFAPSESTFMVNYRVEDLTALLQALRDEGCNVLGVRWHSLCGGRTVTARRL
jgi:hypothetical protein